ncbi:MAG TPA: BMP family ABC transporter substrate-binding protein, partial [Candidatus Limnocylindrales bacterium]|nr:BMP family ABC transporter substrate-binding protein [Candidatus Limnocylindrales bacterium]
MVAGLTTETNILGYVAAHPIPEVLRGINAFTLGARLVNPEAVVQVVWTGTWFDPAIEREAANALLDAGADVLGQHQDSPATQLAAAERGAFGTGNNWDMISMAPTATLTGPVWNWGPFYVETLESIRENTWTNAQHWLPIPGIVDIGPFNDALVPADVQATVMDKRQQIIDGEFVVFAGPITNQEGVVVVAEGQRMTDAELLAMNWFVEGVIGEPAN